MGTASITVTVPDTVAPSIGIVSPYNGSLVTGLVSVTNTVSDNVGVVRVELYVDGAYIGVATAAPWTLTWDTSKGSGGLHTLLTRAYDAAGNSGSAVVTVTASIPGPTGKTDTTPPSIGGTSHPVQIHLYPAWSTTNQVSIISAW